LTAAANHILKHVPSVNRCIWSLGQAPTQVTARPGYMTRERLDLLREADHLVMTGLIRHGIYDDIWQAFAILVPVKTVGVMGDRRTYENLIALRAVTSEDGMTADWYKMPSQTLQKVSSRIINNVSGVNRVVYDITSKPPGTIEWE